MIPAERAKVSRRTSAPIIDIARISVIWETKSAALSPCVGNSEECDDSTMEESLIDDVFHNRRKSCTDIKTRPMSFASKGFMAIKRRTSFLFAYTGTESSTLFELTDEVVDPLTWSGTMG